MHNDVLSDEIVITLWVVSLPFCFRLGTTVMIIGN